MDFPYPGIQTWKNKYGIHIVRLHYSADPDKTPEWAAQQKASMTDPSLYEQEFEINFEATQGQKVFQLHDQATIEKRFPIPPDWTRYYSLDPHPAVPHASLWCAVDPYGDRWYYREYWPSKAYGQSGKVPEDDNRIRIKDYVEVIKWLESDENPENREEHSKRPFKEQIYKRVIDYAARAFGKGTSDDPDSPNFQKRFEDAGDELGIDMRFEDAKKDHDVGVEMVNEGLKPRIVLGPNGEETPRSKIHIFDDMSELLYELRNVRYQQLTPLQAERMDPTGKAIPVRKHMVDDMRYLEMANPIYIPPAKPRSNWKPLVPGIGY